MFVFSNDEKYTIKKKIIFSIDIKWIKSNVCMHININLLLMRYVILSSTILSSIVYKYNSYRVAFLMRWNELLLTNLILKNYGICQKLRFSGSDHGTVSFRQFTSL